jgi:LacI family transcriptional regulator
MLKDLSSAPTMHEIAERAGVAKATVSLALRNDPRLRVETRRRIQKLAEKMGYRTNATVANLMAQLRSTRPPKYQATLGLLKVSSEPKRHTGICTFREWEKSCNERAIQLGYGLDPFWLYEPGISPARLGEILESRNIRGLVVVQLLDRSGLPHEFDPIWEHFACVVVGVRPVWPPLNYCTNDQFATAFHATKRLWEYGYRRMGLVLSPDVDAMVDRRFSAGFWAGLEEVQAAERIPTFPFNPLHEVSFRAWYAQHNPDVILCINHEVKKWIWEMNIKVPEEVGLAHLDCHEEFPDWAGMRQNNTLVGAAAVDMLVAQLHRNEFGLPKYSKASFIQGTWVDGPTIIRRTTGKRPRAAAKAPKAAVEAAGV